MQSPSGGSGKSGALSRGAGLTGEPSGGTSAKGKNEPLF
jgi:hypothetical protein